MLRENKKTGLEVKEPTQTRQRSLEGMWAIPVGVQGVQCMSRLIYPNKTVALSSFNPA